MGIWFGINPCIFTSVFDDTEDCCILIQLVPQAYHPASTLENEFDKHPRRFRREPISLTFAVILGLGVATDVGTDTAALIQAPQYFHSLRFAIDKDL